MTKLREPVSIENALHLVLGELRIEVAAEVTSRTAAYLRAATDPENRQELTVRDQELLDQAHDARFGRGFPLFEALGRRMECARSERFADAAAIGAAAVDLARESGQASAALFDAALDAGRDPRKLTQALREAEDVDRAAGTAVATLKAAIANARPPEPPP